MPAASSARRSAAYLVSMYWEKSRMPRPSYWARSSSATRKPSSVKVGGMRMSMTATSGGLAATEFRSASGSATAPVITKPRSTRSWTSPSRRMAESSAMATRRAPSIRPRGAGRW